MTDLKCILLAMSKNFRQWKYNLRIYLVLVILFVFQWYGFREYTNIAAYLGMPISLCIFPFFVGMPIDAPSFGATAMILYSEAPFADHYAPFTVIRTGRRNWIIGLFLYIIVSSLIYTLTAVLLSFVVLLPNVEFNFDWGEVMWVMARETLDLAAEVGVQYAAMPAIDLLRAMSGEMAMILSILLYWLITVFLGMIILCFNILFKKGVGLVIAGIFTGLSYFSAVFGQLSFGNAVKWVSPVCWRFLLNLKLYSTSTLPPIWYAFTVLIASILIMSVISVIAFCKKDLDFEKGEY